MSRESVARCSYGKLKKNLILTFLKKKKTTAVGRQEMGVFVSQEALRCRDKNGFALENEPVQIQGRPNGVISRKLP